MNQPCLAAAMVTALAIAAVAISPPARAQGAYPDHPIRMVIPFSAGGPNDLVGRPLTERMSELLGQPFVIENKAGANGIIGVSFVAKSPADGYTLLMTTGSFTANPALNPKTPYDAFADFAPITQIAQSYGVALMTRPAFPAKTLKEFVELARANPGKYSYGHAGIGNVTHVAAELLQKLAAIELLQVPYRGTSSFAPDIMSGHVDVGFISTALATPNVNSGLLRGLALTGTRRSPSLPQLPTFQEFGYADMDLYGYFGLWFPAGTPRERIDAIHRAVVTALDAPLVKKMIADTGLMAVGSTPEQFTQFLHKDFAFQAAVIKRIGLQPQ